MYEQYYKEFCGEVHQIVCCYLFWRMISERIRSGDKALQIMNYTPLSWIFIQYSLLANLLVSLARVFDTNGKSMSIGALISCCIDEVSVFSRESIRQRKVTMSNSNFPKEFWDQYIENCYEPTTQDFQVLKGEISKRRKIFRERYLPIRDKIIAHKDISYVGKTDELWSNADIQELENIIWFLCEIKEILFDAFHNGNKPELQGRKPKVDVYEKDFKVFLDRLTLI